MERLYTIGEVARRLNISISTLKTWERRGYISPARRIKRSKIRAYTEEQIQEINRFMQGEF
jgi:DNA-binding transcriptional MerR regulator